MPGAGWEFYLAAIDDASRLAYGEVIESERKEDVVAFLKRVVVFFERQGVTISQLMTDTARPIDRRRVGGRSKRTETTGLDSLCSA